MRLIWPRASSSSRARFSSSTTARSATSARHFATGRRRNASACWCACGCATRAAAPTTANSGEMPLPLRPRLDVCALLGEDLGDALGREADLEQAQARIGDFAILSNLAVAQDHDRHAVEADPLALGLGQG